jgi:proprotein convertase subtilisin/kexin type 5
MTLSISGITSPKSFPGDSTVFTTYDPKQYIIDQSSTDINFTLACNLPCKTCPSTDLNNCTSCYNDTTITTSIYFNEPSNKCVTTCNSGYYPDSTQFKCTACNSICGNCSIAANNCTSCINNSGFPYLNTTDGSGTCLANCYSGYYPDTNQSPIRCVLCVKPCVTCTSENSCLSCNLSTYLYQNECISTCPSTNSVVVNQTCIACST